MKKRIVCEVSDRFHRDLKKKAASHNITMKAYILEILISHFRKEYELDKKETDAANS